MNTINYKTKKYNLGTRLAPKDYKDILKLVEAGIFINMSDFVREAVKDKLKAIKVINIKDIDYETAKKEVLGYYKKYNEAYDYEASEHLELNHELVCQILKELKYEGRLKEE